MPKIVSLLLIGKNRTILATFLYYAFLSIAWLIVQKCTLVQFFFVFFFCIKLTTFSKFRFENLIQVFIVWETKPTKN